MTAVVRIIRQAALFCAIALLAACASGAKPVAMAPYPEPTAVDNAYASAVKVVSVTGGEETSPLWTSEISSADFRAALEMALTRGGFSNPLGPFALTADLMEVEQPIIGLSLTVTTVVKYTLKDESGGVVFEEIVRTPHTTEFSESFIAVERLRLANEGAVRANLSRFINMLETAGDASEGDATVTS